MAKRKTKKSAPETIGGKATDEATTTVKMRTDLHRMARTIASHRDMDLTDYLDQLLRSVLRREYDQMAESIKSASQEG